MYKKTDDRMTEDRMMSKVDDLGMRVNDSSLTERELVILKGECNVWKSQLYSNMEMFRSKSTCLLYINMLNSYIELVDFDLNFRIKLLSKIREKVIESMSQEEWVDFINECKSELR